jgi:enoyl-CoA hydratase
MENNTIIFDEIKGKFLTLGQITLNRPKALNALNLEMIRAIDRQLMQWAQADHIDAVMIRSGDSRAFCAGGDIREIHTHGHQAKHKAIDFFQHEYRLNERIHSYPKPYIALMDGLTMGGGVGISIHGTYRIATENLIFAMPETSIGFFPDIGASYFLSRCPGKTGLYLGLTSARLTTADALALGLVDLQVPSDQLDAIVKTIVNADSIITAIKTLHTEPTGKPPIEQYRQEIDRCFSANTIEEILARLEEKNTDWHQETLQALRQKSPTSLKVTLKQLQRSGQLDLRACLQMEYHLATHFLNNPDFYEGVRAMIIDKDRAPHWSPNTLESVSETDVDSYFIPIPNQELVFTE